MVVQQLKRAGMLTLAASAMAGGLVFTGAGTASAAPFVCTGQVFLAQAVNNNTQGQLYGGTFGEGNITFSPIGAPAIDNYNAIGYNTVDNYLYGIRGTNGGLWRINSDGTATGFGPPAGLPAPGTVVNGVTITGYNVGTFDDQGNFYVTMGTAPYIWVVNPVTNSVVKRIDLNGSTSYADFVFADGYLWGVATNGTVTRVNPNTGAVENFNAGLPAGTFGGAFAYGNGDLGMYENNGTLYRLQVTNPASASPAFQIISTQAGPASGGNDATSCVAQPTDLGIIKDGPAQVNNGETVTYTLTVLNNGPGTSTGYTVTDSIPAGLTNVTTSSPGCGVANMVLTCTGGSLGVGDSTTITVSGTADGSVETLFNTAKVRGNEEDPNPDNDNSNTVTTVVVPMFAAPLAAGALALAGGGFALRRRRNSVR
ncbi:DUF11 domain-containing protein [Amycolatopsis sp. NPDC006131]|uniref:DUF11 domain-containing protein n=1 Tax=Amycolatopsis sp. NPDC006131 TaxID=3156731 RepID=UPI0033ADED71